MVYCELRSPSSGQATFAIYANEHCNYLLDTFPVTSDSTLISYESIHSNIFTMDGCFFCARTLPEQKLWLRALMNVKMMLMSEATEATGEQLKSFRSDASKQVDRLKIAEHDQSFFRETPQTEKRMDKMAGVQEFVGKRSASMDCTHSKLPWSLGSRQHWSAPLQISFNCKHSPKLTKIGRSWLSRLVPRAGATPNGN